MSETNRTPAAPSGGSRPLRILYLLVFVPLARLRFVIILAAITVVLLKWDFLVARFEQYTGWKEQAAGAGEYEYFCPMHLAIVREDNKQKCPICNMPLSRRKKEDPAEAESLPDGIVSRVQLSPYRVVLAGAKTTSVAYQPLFRDITSIGTVEFDERGLKKISARLKGRIDKLRVNETGHLVTEDEELAELYSPEFAVTVENLLRAHKSKNQEAEDNARERLRLWGVLPKRIDKIIADDKPLTHLTITAPITGHVLKKYPLEGQYVDEGSPLYDIADIRTVWVQAQLYEDDMAFLPKGTHDPATGLAKKKLRVTATARAFPGRAFEGELSFVYPHLDPDTRTRAVRFVLQNPDHELPPGMTMMVRLHLDANTLADLPVGSRLQMQGSKVLSVPERSIIDTGDHKVVYREIIPNQYEGVDVALGPRMLGANGEVFYPLLRHPYEEKLSLAAAVGASPLLLTPSEVERWRHRLKIDDIIVTNGSFLIDAETRLNPAAGSIYIGGSGGSAVSGPQQQVRPSMPDDNVARIEAAYKALPPDKRALARAQRYCPEQNIPLGSMGTIYEIDIDGKPVFLCCKVCIKPAKANPEGTRARVEEYRKRFAGDGKSKG